MMKQQDHEELQEKTQPMLGKDDRTIQLALSSELGVEKRVRQTLAQLGAELQLGSARLADLQTAVSEACINAIEHGNQLRRELCLDVTLRVATTYLEVLVRDAGVVPFQPPVTAPASMQDKLAGRAPARGMGLLLMQQLVDEVDFLAAAPGAGTCVRLRLYCSDPPGGGA
jgi:serine/threonine-protein kinase RsbW